MSVKLLTLSLFFLIAASLFYWFENEQSWLAQPTMQKEIIKENLSAAEYKKNHINSKNSQESKFTPLREQCQATFDFTVRQNNQSVTGLMYLRSFGTAEQGHAFALQVALTSPHIESYPPAIFYTNAIALYKDHYMTPELAEELIASNLQVIYAIQWSRTGGRGYETDGLGMYKVQYSSNGYSKQKILYRDKPNIKLLDSNASASYNAQSCYWDSMTASETIEVASSQLSTPIKVQYASEFKRYKGEKVIFPKWMQGDLMEAKTYIDQYKLPPRMNNVNIPDFSLLDKTLTLTNVSKARNIILMLLEYDAFIDRFVKQLLSGNSEFSPANIARIIALLPVKNNNKTQTATMALLSSPEVLIKHRFQAAVALGDFKTIYIGDLSDRVIQSFLEDFHPLEFRSALMASLGRLASNLQDSDPEIYTEIVGEIADLLPDSKEKAESAGMILDALYNTKSINAYVVDRARSYSLSQQPTNRVRAAAILANANLASEVGQILEKENNIQAQQKIIAKAESNRIQIDQYVIPFLDSSSKNVRGQALGYLASRKELSNAVLDSISRQFNNETNPKNRMVIINLMRKNGTYQMLSADAL